MVDILKVVRILRKEYPDAKIALNYGSNFELLVAVILSAQCTDERVNSVTPALFARFGNAMTMANCEIGELEKLIYSTGFYRAKARNIRAMANMLVKDFGGEVPDEMEELLRLPGVARKTANVVLHSAFGRAEGIVVDTHVARLAGLLGIVPMQLSQRKDAVKIEGAIMKVLPRSLWGVFPHLLILHGRKVCIARRPRCGSCILKNICPSAFKGQQ